MTDSKAYDILYTKGVILMTKKHFKALAQIFYSEGAFTRDMDNDEAKSIPTAEELLKRIIHRVADYCSTENSRFSRTRFIDACINRKGI